MLWYPDNTEGASHKNMMASSLDAADESERLPENNGSDRYRMVIMNKLQFFLAIDYLASGLSFRKVSRVLHHTKKCSGLGIIGACSNVTLLRYARFACAANLRKDV